MRKTIMIIAAVAVIATGCAQAEQPPTQAELERRVMLAQRLERESRSWVEYEACMNTATYPKAVARCMKIKP